MLMGIKRMAQKAMEPLARACNINPNFVTLLSLLVMMTAAYAVFIDSTATAALLIILSGFLDLLDGEVARVRKCETRFGSWLDKVADRASDAIILASVIIAGLVSLPLGIAVLIIILLASYESAVLDSHAKRQLGSRLSMRGLRLIIIAAGLAAAQMQMAFALLLILGAAAGIERLVMAGRMLKDR